MIDLTSALTDTLRTVADDDDVHVEHLLAGARRGGARYRRRHRLVVLGCTALSGALVAGGLAAVHPLRAGRPSAVVAATPVGSPSAVAAATAPALMTAMPPLPSAAAASALAAPVELGRDPLLLHVWLARLPYPAASVQVLSIDGQESLRVDGPASGTGPAPGFVVQAGRRGSDLDALSGTQHSVTVGGHAGVAAVDAAGGRPFTTIRWQPAAGLWVQVAGAIDQAAAAAVATEVRLDEVHRCAAPFRLSHVPAGARVTSCGVAFVDGDVQATVGVRVAAWSVTVGVLPGGVRDPNEVLGGRPARVVQHGGDGGAPIMEVTVDRGDRVADLTAEGPYDPAVVRSLAAGVVPAGGTDPADWPVSPLT